MEVLSALLERTWQGWTDAMALDLDIGLVLDRVLGPAAAITVALFATISTLLGRSVVLAVNRLRRGGMLFALLINFIGYLATYAIVAAIVWAIGEVLFDTDLVLTDVVWSVLWAMSPHVLGFLTAVPVLGPAVDRVITIWSVLVLWRIIEELFVTSVVVAGALTVGAWLVAWLASLVYGPLVARGRDRLWRRVTGKPLYDSSRYVLDQATLDTPGRHVLSARPAPTTRQEG